MVISIKDVLLNINSLSQSFLYQVLIIFIILDLLTGIGKAIIQKRLNSDIGINGLLTHIFVIIIQTIIGLYCRALGAVFFSQAIAVFFIGFYGVSLCENLYFIGVPIPNNVKKYFEQMQQVDIQIPNSDNEIKSNQTSSVDND